MEPNYDYIQKGAKIWCYNPEIEKKKDPQGPPFICGEVTYLDKNKKLLEISAIDKKIRFTQTLPMINGEDIDKFYEDCEHGTLTMSEEEIREKERLEAKDIEDEDDIEEEDDID